MRNIKKNRNENESKNNLNKQQNIKEQNRNNYRICLAINTKLYTTINNYLKARWINGDYKYSSFSDFFRNALKRYQKEKFSLNISRETGIKKDIAVRMEEDIYYFYKSLLPQKRTEIIEKILEIHLKS